MHKVGIYGNQLTKYESGQTHCQKPCFRLAQTKQNSTLLRSLNIFCQNFVLQNVRKITSINILQHVACILFPIENLWLPNFTLVHFCLHVSSIIRLIILRISPVAESVLRTRKFLRGKCREDVNNRTQK